MFIRKKKYQTGTEQVASDTLEQDETRGDLLGSLLSCIKTGPPTEERSRDIRTKED